MKVFRMRVDVNHYQYFLTDPVSDYRRLYMDGTSVHDTWQPPTVFVLYPKRPAGDFYNTNNSVLITSPYATEALHRHLAWAGEMLELPYKSQVYTLLNVTKCIDVLDHTKTEFRYGETSGVCLGIVRYAFHPDRFAETSLFKIPEFNANEIFVLEGGNDFNMEFREAVAAADLKGLLFTEIWSDEE